MDNAGKKPVLQLKVYYVSYVAVQIMYGVL